MNTHQSIIERPSPEPRWLMPVVDVALVFLAFMLGYYIRYELQIIRRVIDPSGADFAPYIPYIALYAGILYVHSQSSGLYKNVRGRAWTEDVYTISSGVAYATVILLALFFVFQPLVTSRLMLVYVAILTVLLLSLARLVRMIALSYLRSKGVGIQNVLIVGMGEAGQAVLRTLVARTSFGYKPVGFLDDNISKGEADLGRVKGLGALDKLRERIREYQVDLVIITLPWAHYDKIQELSRQCQEEKAQVRLVPDLFQLNLRQVQVENLDGITLLGVNGDKPFRGTSRIFKRALDTGLVLLTAPIWLIVFAVIAIAIRLEGEGPILYPQKRVGENGREFMMFKFRSMVPDADKYQSQIMEQAGEDLRHPKIKDDPRITRVGKWIRRASLDELPNVLNVLRGQMSLVGPRPPTPEEVELYEPWHEQRLNIIPGMTGLWQISGRSDIPFEEMCLLDIYYIENWSINMDLKILLMTIPRVLLGSGAY